MNDPENWKRIPYGSRQTNWMFDPSKGFQRDSDQTWAAVDAKRSNGSWETVDARRAAPST